MYSEDTHKPAAASSTSLHVPIALLALATAVFLGAQIGASSQGGKVMQWQLESTTKQIENVKTAQKQLAELMVKRGELVKQSAQVQAQYTSLLNDVLELSKTDEDAKKIVQKWNVQRAEPPAEAKPAEPAVK